MSLQKSNSFIKIFAVILQNNEGIRFYSKYYFKYFPSSTYNSGGNDLTKLQHQRTFQRALLNKAKRMEVLGVMKPQDTQIFTYGKFVVLFKVINEVQIYVVADQDQNEVLVSGVLDCIQKVLGFITKEPQKLSVSLENLQEIILTIDEILDEGIPVTLQPEIIYNRIKMKEVQIPSPSKPVQQQKSTVSSLFGFAKSSLQKALNMG